MAWRSWQAIFACVTVTIPVKSRSVSALRSSPMARHVRRQLAVSARDCADTKELRMSVKIPNTREDGSSRTPTFIEGLWGVRYQVTDVRRSVDFYINTLGFQLDHQNLPAFGQVSIGNLKLILSGPGASGSRPMPDGGQQEPGGWNRVILHVKDLPSRVDQLKKRGVHFRNEMEVGPGGRQIQVDDPDGNPIELFEPAER
jgi:glyoxylase I family protein